MSAPDDQGRAAGTAPAPGQVDRTLAAVLARWDLAPVRSIERATSGVMNETYVVTTADRRVVLRRHRRTERRLVELEHRIIGYARDRGVPAPAALRTPDGALAVEDGGRLYSLFAHAPGRQLGRAELRPGHARSMGSVLALLQDALADFPIPLTPPKPDPPRPSETLARVRDHIARVSAWESPTEQERWTLDDLHARAALLERPEVATELVDTPTAAHQLVHGDFQESNLFFSGETVVAVIDWDKAEVRWPPAELIRTLDLAFGLDIALGEAFLAGYRTVRAVATDDLDLAAHNYGVWHLHGLWVYDTVYLRRDDRCRRFIRPGGYASFADAWARARSHLA